MTPITKATPNRTRSSWPEFRGCLWKEWVAGHRYKDCRDNARLCTHRLFISNIIHWCEWMLSLFKTPIKSLCLLCSVILTNFCLYIYWHSVWNFKKTVGQRGIRDWGPGTQNEQISQDFRLHSSPPAPPTHTHTSLQIGSEQSLFICDGAGPSLKRTQMAEHTLWDYALNMLEKQL